MTDSSLVCYFYIIFIAEIFYVFLSLMYFRPHLEIYTTWNTSINV